MTNHHCSIFHHMWNNLIHLTTQNNHVCHVNQIDSAFWPISPAIQYQISYDLISHAICWWEPCNRPYTMLCCRATLQDIGNFWQALSEKYKYWYPVLVCGPGRFLLQITTFTVGCGIKGFAILHRIAGRIDQMVDSILLWAWDDLEMTLKLKVGGRRSVALLGLYK